MDDMGVIDSYICTNIDIQMNIEALHTVLTYVCLFFEERFNAAPRLPIVIA